MDVVGVTVELSTDGLKRFSALKIPAQVTAADHAFRHMAFERSIAVERLERLERTEPGGFVSAGD